MSVSVPVGGAVVDASGKASFLHSRCWFRPAEGERSLIDAGVTLASLGSGLFIVNGEGEADTSRVVRDGDRVILVDVPAGPTTPFVIKLIAAFVISFVISRLLSKPIDAREPRSESSRTYGWNGVRTEYTPRGLPYPLILGEHYYGGVVLQVYVEVVNGPEPVSYLYVLLCISTGPIKSIAGITADRDNIPGSGLKDAYINGNPIVDYDVEAAVRLGALQQEPIPWFSLSRQQFDVDLPLDQTTKEDFDAGTPLLTDWELAVEKDLTVECENATVTLSFPSGVARLDSNGEYQPVTISFAFRYRAISAGGSPTGPWQVHYFGVDQTFDLAAAIPQAFEYDLPVEFLDPATITPPALGPGATRFNFNYTTVEEYAISDVLQGESSWVAGAEVQGFSVVYRAERRLNQPNAYAWSWYDPTNFEGITFVMVNDDMTVEMGDGAALVPVLVHAFSSYNINEPTTITVTYERDPIGTGLNRVRIWSETTMKLEVLTSVVLHVPATPGDFRLNTRHGLEATVNSRYDVDEVEVWSRALTAAELDRKDGTSYVEPLYPAENLVAYWKMGDAQVVDWWQDSSGHGNNLTAATAIAGYETLPGWTYTRASGTRVRGRYRTQTQRLDAVFDANPEYSDLARLQRITAISSDEIAYAGLACIGYKIRATDSLSNSRPDIVQKAEGRTDCPVWDGNDPDNPTFDLQYSKRPADHLALLVLDRRDGGGAFHGPRDIDWEEMDAWRTFTDRRVYDQRGKYVASEIEWILASDAGYSDVVYPDGLYRIVLPVDGVAHFEPGYEVKVSDVGDGEFPVGVAEILAVWTDGTDTFILAPWDPATAFPPTTNPFTDPDAADVWGVRPQIESNLVLADRGVSFWGAVQMITSIGRGAPVRLGDKLSVAYQDTRQPAALFTGANIVAGSFVMRATRKEEQYNSAVGEISDEENRNERLAIERRHASLKNAASTAARRHTTYELRGVTAKFQARRELDFLLNVSQAENLAVEFDTFWDAAFLRPSQVAVVTYPLPSWAFGDVVATAATADTQLPISVEVVLDAATTYYAAVKSATTEEIAFVQVSSGAGTYPAGSELTLAGALPFVPDVGDLWAVGTSEFSSRTFQLVDRVMTQRGLIHLSLVEHSNDVYPSDDDFEDIELLTSDGGQEGTGLAALTGGSITATSTVVAAREEASRSPITGAASIGFYVSWTPSRATAHRIASTRVWIQTPGGAGRTLIATVGPGVRAVRASPQGLVRGQEYEVLVQHVAQSGDAVPLAMAPRDSVVILGSFSPPQAPTSGVEAGGEKATYEVTLPAGTEGAAIDVFRGGTFVGAAVGRIPAGGSRLGPTDDWVVTSATPQLLFRPTLPNGIRGELFRLNPTHVPDEYSEELAAEDFGAGPWDTEPGGAAVAAVLTELVIDSSGFLAFDSGSSELVGTYDSWEFDLGAPKTVHVGFGITGVQVNPVTPADLEGVAGSSARLRSWTGEGPLDPGDPFYGRVAVELEWMISTTSGDPSGGTWIPYRPGVAYVRSAIFRIKITRPSAAWDVEVQSGAVSVRRGRAVARGEERTIDRSISLPGSSENRFLFRVERPTTILEVSAVLVGSASPSITWNLAHSTTRDDGSPSDVWSADKTTTSTSTPDNFTAFDGASIPAGSLVWLTSSAQSGIVTALDLSIRIRED